MARQTYSRLTNYQAREQFNDYLSDTFAQVHKDQKIFYVGSVNGNANYSGRRITSQVATIAQAITLCTASRGDMIFVDPFHTETSTVAISLSKIGIQLKGLEIGNQRPVITINGAVDLFSLDAAGCSISGMDLTIATTDAATALINATAAKCRISNVKMIGSATSVNVVDCITLASGANDILIEDVQIYNTTVPVNSFLSIEAAVARMKMRNVHFFGDCATAGIIDSATATQLFWDNVNVATVGTTIPAAVLDSNPTGMIINSRFAGTSTTLANNAALGTGVRLFNVLVLEETDGSKQGAQIPAVDAD